MSDGLQSSFNGWAIVDVLGHQRFAGRVLSVQFGTATFFHVDTPRRHERSRVAAPNEYVAGKGIVPEGCTIVESGRDGSVRFIGAGSNYMLTPVSEDAVYAWLDENEPRAKTVTKPDGTPFEEVDLPF